MMNDIWILLAIIFLLMLMFVNKYEPYKSLPIDEESYLFSGVYGSADYTQYNPYVFYHDDFPKVYFDGAPPSYYYNSAYKNSANLLPDKKSYNFGYHPYFHFKGCHKISGFNK